MQVHVGLVCVVFRCSVRICREWVCRVCFMYGAVCVVCTIDVWGMGCVVYRAYVVWGEVVCVRCR